MINWISIKNLALVEKADIEFGSTFNVVTGETGAGKSVIIGSIGMILGSRADRSSIRSGEDRCEVSAGILIAKHVAKDVKEILENAGIDFKNDDELTIRRVITASSARNFINDVPVSLQIIKDLGDLLIDIHGANEHQSLFRQNMQLQILDRYASLESAREKCAGICEDIREVKKRREELLGGLPSPIEAEHLKMSVAEIEKAAPRPGEDTELSARHALAANSRHVIECAARISSILTESENSAADMIAEVYRAVHELERIDSAKGSEFMRSCDSIAAQIKELSSDISSYAESVELDEREFNSLEERLRQLQTLKRRYGPSIDDILSSLETARKKLEAFENVAELKESLENEEQTLVQKLKNEAAKLSDSRKKAAIKLSKEVSASLKNLGFLKADFSIAFEAKEPAADGMDKIDFIFAPNPGEAARPLREIASSGEMSRVMLALKTVIAENDSVPVLLFDEIDVNIGGETAVKVGEALKKLSSTHQVLCISHLPQVAAAADRHMLVSKQVSGKRTSSSITVLEGKERQNEIARMLGGTKAASEHAAELLKVAAK